MKTKIPYLVIPKLKTQTKRPSKNRSKRNDNPIDNPINPTRKSRKVVCMPCSHCRVQGHNFRGCPTSTTNVER